MFVKIVRDYLPHTQMLFECFGYELNYIKTEDHIPVKERVVLAFSQDGGVSYESESDAVRVGGGIVSAGQFKAEMFLRDRSADWPLTQVLLRDCTVYVMSDQGSTVDTHYI